MEKTMSSGTLPAPNGKRNPEKARIVLQLTHGMTKNPDAPERISLHRLAYWAVWRKFSAVITSSCIEKPVPQEFQRCIMRFVRSTANRV